MNTFLALAMSNVLAALLLAVLALAVSLIFRRPAVTHAMWLLVLLKLVTPPLIPVPVPDLAGAMSSVADRSGEGSEASSVQSLPEGQVIEGLPLVWEVVPPEEVSSSRAEMSSAEAPSPTTERKPIGNRFQQAMPWLMTVWLVGSVGWLILALNRLHRFGRLLRMGGKPGPDLERRVRALSEKLRLSRPPGVLILQGRFPPMIWGLGKPRILLPEKLLEELNPEERDTLLVHELAHLRRGDNWVRLLESLTLALYWWLPLTWLALRELRRAEEQCCDAWVVRILRDSARSYANALVKTLDFLSHPVCAIPPLASGLGQVADLKRRLILIMRGSTSPRMGLSASLAVTGLATLLLPFVPSFVQAQDNPEKQELRRGIEKKQQEIRRMREELERRSRELEEMNRRLGEQRGNPPGEGKDRGPRGQGFRLEMKDGIEIPMKGGNTNIRIEIQGLENIIPEDCQALVEKIRRILPGKNNNIMVFRSGNIRGEAKGQMILRAQDNKGEEKGTMILELDTREGFKIQPGGPTPGNPPPPVQGRVIEGARLIGRPGPEANQRIENLERKLDAVMRELETLRRDMPRGPRGPDGDRRPRDGRGPGGPDGDRGPRDGRGPGGPDNPPRPPQPPMP